MNTFRITIALGLTCWMVTGAMALPRHWPDATKQDADLHDVTFVDRDFGWAVGDRGTIWHTQDGGRHWHLQSTPVDCPLWSVDFVDRAHGWAVGGRTLPYVHRGAGVVLRTTNGGQSWEPMPSEMLPTLFECQFTDRSQGGASSSWSPLFRDRGLTTSDGGRTWSGAAVPQQALASAILQQLTDSAKLPVRPFEFETAAAVPGRVWLAGSPGTRIFRSDDGGETWEGFETGVSLPLRGLEFVDAQRGWAVGALGTILSSNDGGMTWSCQQGAGRRCAALIVAPSLDLIPYTAIAELAAVHGYRTHLLVLNSEVEERRHHVQARVRLQEAMASLAAHGATYWGALDAGRESAAPDAALIAWQSPQAEAAVGGHVDPLVQRLTAAFRMWSPDVVYFATRAETRGLEGSREQRVSRAMDAAILAASNERHFPELWQEASLAAWQIRGTTALVHDASLHASASPRLCVPLAASTGDLAEDAQAKIAPSPTRALAYEPRAPSGTPVRLTQGIRSPVDSDVRRPSLPLTMGDFEPIALQAQRTTQITAMIDRMTMDKSDVQATQITGMASQLEPDRTVRVLVRLASALESLGEWPSAQETWSLISRRFESSPFADVAWQQQWRQATSAEVHHRSQRKTGRNAHGAITRVVSASGAKTPAGVALGHLPRGQSVTDGLLQEIPFSFQKDPRVEFGQLRGLATHRSAQQERLWQRLIRTTEDARWETCARAELALIDPLRDSPKPTLISVQGQRPVIDGRLEDPLWQLSAAEPIQLGGHAQVWIAHDTQHLYVAMKADKLAGVSYNTPSEPRRRDADLSQRDRLQIFLDVDRDYETGWSLEVDHRGWGAERLMHDRYWNPTWYIASSDTELSWTIECAIPLAELGETAVQQQTWGLGLRRMVPTSRSTVPSVAAWPQGLESEVAWTDLGYLTFGTSQDLP